MSNLPGGYTPYTCTISNEAKEAFGEAVRKLLGVRYFPVAVATQVVSGTNYKFFCNTEAVTVRPLYGAAILTIYAPLKGDAHITHIQTL